MSMKNIKLLKDAIILKDATILKRALIGMLPNVIKASDRGVSKQFRYKSNNMIKKTFVSTTEARQSMR